MGNTKLAIEAVICLLATALVSLRYIIYEFCFEMFQIPVLRLARITSSLRHDIEATWASIENEVDYPRLKVLLRYHISHLYHSPLFMTKRFIHAQ